MNEEALKGLNEKIISGLRSDGKDTPSVRPKSTLSYPNMSNASRHQHFLLSDDTVYIYFYTLL